MKIKEKRRRGMAKGAEGREKGQEGRGREQEKGEGKGRGKRERKKSQKIVSLGNLEVDLFRAPKHFIILLKSKHFLCKGGSAPTALPRRGLQKPVK